MAEAGRGPKAKIGSGGEPVEATAMAAESTMPS